MSPSLISDANEYSEEEAAFRADATLKRMLATKPTPHKPKDGPKKAEPKQG